MNLFGRYIKDTAGNSKRHTENSVHELECIERNHIGRPPIPCSSYLSHPPE